MHKKDFLITSAGVLSYSPDSAHIPVMNTGRISLAILMRLKKIVYALFLLFPLVVISNLTNKVYAASYPPTAGANYLYTFPEGNMSVYDIDNNFSLVTSINLATKGVRGVMASAATGMLYISFGSASDNPGSLMKYNLVTNKVVWTRSYGFGVDSGAITPDGKTIYMPNGEFSSNPFWYVLNAVDGSVITRITAGKGPHNTVVGLSGKNVYLNGVGTPYLEVADTTTNGIINMIGPLKSGGRPFTINGTEKLSFTTATNFLGFQVSDIISGKVLYTVPVSGFNDNGAEVPSHGISLSPDEKEIYVIDGVNNYVHVYDASNVLTSAPTKVADIKLGKTIIGATESGCSLDCDKIGWVLHNRDGRYVFVGDAGDIIDTTTRQIVKNLDTLSNTRKFLEIDWQNGSPSFTTSRHGLGYVTIPQQGQSVVSFSLINADTNQPVGDFNPLPNNSTINLSTLPTKNINIRANTYPLSVGSVKFALDGNLNYRVENVAPYALASDNDGDYLAWTPSIGSHTVVATPYTGSNTSGTVGSPLSINFTVTDQPSTSQSISSFSLINADTDQPISGFDPLPDKATINLQNLPTRNLNMRANSNPTTVGSVLFALDSNSNYRIENNAPYALASDNNGDYFAWTPTAGSHALTATPFSNSNASGIKGTLLTITFTVLDQVSTPQTVSSYTLINADTDQPIIGFDPISNNSTISLSALPTKNLNVRANTNPLSVGSVKFGLDSNSNYRIENNAPYALASDNNGDYFAWTPSVGTHTITSTPFTEKNATGVIGNSLNITLNIAN